MSEKSLQPILHRTSYNRAIERELVAWLREAVFTPLTLAMSSYRHENSYSALAAAIRAGTIVYHKGAFSGKFSSALSRELHEMDARFDRSTKTFRIAHDKIPYELRGAIAESIAESREKHEAVLSVLASIVLNLPQAKPELPREPVHGIMADLDKQFMRSIAGIPGVGAGMSEGERQRLTDELTVNLELSITDFIESRIPHMRRMVEQNLAEGGSTAMLAKKLEAEFGLAQRKADFLADNETGLLVSKYRQIRYEAIGVQEYQWHSMEDERVRPDHAALEGRRFSFDNPPITDRATGRRNNPGEDYRCRCVALPILNLIEA